MTPIIPLSPSDRIADKLHNPPNRCALCPGISNVVPGYGPQQADYFFLAEAPGRDEDRKGIPLIGKTGREFTEHYLPLAGIHPLQIYKDNVVSCLPKGDGKLDPHEPRDQALIKCCAEHHVYEAIRRTKPKYIIPMGGVAASLIPGLDLDIHYAIPYTWDVPGVGEHTVFPTWHPALGLHSPKEMLKIRNCFIRLRKFLKGELVVPEDQYPNPDYTVLNTAEEVDLYIQEDTNTPLAMDTEITKDHDPFCLTFSVRPGTARLIRAQCSDALGRLDWWLKRWRGRVLLHNRLFDRPVLSRMGVIIPSKLIADTMMEAYHLGNMPQGLKALVYRYLGVEMGSFDDLVSPYSTAKVLEYYSQAVGMIWDKPEEELVRDKTGQWKMYKPQAFGTKLKRFFTDYGKNPKVDIFDRWWGWEMHHQEIEAKLGRWPGKCISHVPFDKVIHYACQDAARTLELWPIMKLASTRVRRVGQEDWFD